jgi:hypothetical protein
MFNSMSNTTTKKPIGKAIFFFMLAIMCIVAIFYSYFNTVVPAKEECDRVADEARAFNREHAGEPGMYVRPATC